jgi:hypothetical protein
LKATREKHQVTYKGKLIRVTADFSKETLKAKRSWNDVFRALKETAANLHYCIQQNYLSQVKEK